jgi:hypothetical protein
VKEKILHLNTIFGEEEEEEDPKKIEENCVR